MEDSDGDNTVNQEFESASINPQERQLGTGITLRRTRSETHGRSARSAPTLQLWLRNPRTRGRQTQRQLETTAPLSSQRGSDSPLASNVDREAENTFRVDTSSMVDSSEREDKWDKVGDIRSLSPTCKTVGKEEWMWELMEAKRRGLVSKSFLNDLIMNYLIVQGYQAAAEQFQLEMGVEPGVDLKSIDGRIGICDAILRGDTAKAIKLCNACNPSILKSDLKLQYELHLQITIDLINNGDAEAALNHSAEYLTPLIGEQSDPSLRKRLEQALLLLILPSNDDNVRELLSNNHRVKMAHLANCAILAHQHPGQSWPSPLGGESQIADFIRLVVRSQERVADMKVDTPQIRGLCLKNEQNE